MRTFIKFRLKKWDILLFAMPILIGVVTFLMIFTFNSNDKIAIVEIDNVVVAEVPLDGSFSGQIDVQPKYHNKIVVRDGKIGVETADCKDNVCVNTGFIDKVGQSVICVPSKLIITVREK